MTSLRIRPTFTIPLSLDPDEAMALIRTRLQGSRYAECSRSRGRCADLYLDQKARKLWSPYLSIQVEEGENGTILRGRYGPHPEVWTLFMFLYAAVGFLAVMGLMLGFVQWQSGMAPWGFRGFYLGVPGLALLYWISATGQHLSSHQMQELRDRIDPLLVDLRQDPAETGVRREEAIESRDRPGQG